MPLCRDGSRETHSICHSQYIAKAVPQCGSGNPLVWLPPATNATQNIILVFILLPFFVLFIFPFCNALSSICSTVTRFSRASSILRYLFQKEGWQHASIYRVASVENDNSDGNAQISHTHDMLYSRHRPSISPLALPYPSLLSGVTKCAACVHAFVEGNQSCCSETACKSAQAEESSGR